MSEAVTLAADGAAELDVRRLSPHIGAEIHGVDLPQELGDDVIAAIRGALLEHKVIFFRDQDLTRPQHLRFARRFGPLEIHPATPADQQDPEVLRIAHGPNSRGSENNWHSTSPGAPSRRWVPCSVRSTCPCPRRHALLVHVRGVRGVSPGMKEWVCPRGEHDIARHAKRLRTSQELREKYPVQRHPVVRTHPETGRRGLYVNTGFTESISA